MERWTAQWRGCSSGVFPAVLPRILMLAGGGEEGRDNDIVRDTLERTGASVMGERMFGPGEQPWPRGSVPPAVFVVTHEKRDPWERRSGTTDDRVRVADTLRQAAMRRAVANGTASPGDVGLFEAEMQEGGRGVAESIAAVSRIVLDYRHERQVVVGPWAMACRLMEAAHAAGVPDGDFHPDTVVSIAGGLKGLTLRMTIWIK